MPNRVDHHGPVLSADGKPRLKWTRQLHEQFVDAVSELGGAEKATPKLLMRLMAVPGLTLYHLKSHLQKYRLAKNRDPSTVNNDKKTKDDELKNRNNKSQPQFNEAILQQIQIDVHRKLQEQIEVQKHLQLRIEAQGKYLQSVLKIAQETLAGYSSTLGTEAARSELSELVSVVETECLSSSLNHGGLISKGNQNADSSMDSCLTSELFELREKFAGQHKLEASSCSNPVNSRTAETRGEIEEFDLNK